MSAAGRPIDPDITRTSLTRIRVTGILLGYQDSNLEQLNQNQPCCQLHHTPPWALPDRAHTLPDQLCAPKSDSMSSVWTRSPHADAPALVAGRAVPAIRTAAAKLGYQ